MKTTRGELLRRSAFAAAALVAGWRTFDLTTSHAATIGYGPLGPPDPNGVSLPPGFRARLLAKSGEPVVNTSYVWPGQPDGSGTFALEGGGWLFGCNSELNGTSGGASAIRFGSNGEPVAAYRILSGTKWNCAGGMTPWGTWLSCEEFRNGLVWECNPSKPGQGVARRALGVFAHEAAPVDPATGHVYLTEDDYDARLYRFRPKRYGRLGAGTLEAASVAADGAVTWLPVPATRPYRGRDTTPFDRCEGAWISRGFLYFTTTADDRVWALDLAARHLSVIYDGLGANAGDALHEPDNITVHEPTGDLFVAEDSDDLQLVQLVRSGGSWAATPFLQLLGHDGSEVTGPSFSPDGRRLYVTSQRGTDGDGMTFEVTGPFAT
jgi:secreted PhoX family phosphatase